MQHSIDTDALGPRGEAMGGAIGACVHCGFCLPTCPTYVELGEEMDSPRGRIFLMKEVLEGKLELDDALPALDNCLGCQACQTACPSGVEYGDLITAFRAHAEPLRDRPPLERAQREVVLRTLPYPRRFRVAARAGGLAKPVVKRLPSTVNDVVEPMVDLLPASLPRAGKPLPEIHPATGSRRARVALLAGCAQQVLAPEINWATLRVLAHNGVETVIPRQQGCCGALAMHTGAAEQAMGLARRNILAFPDDVDAVITTAAGCGSGMREYGLLLAGEPDEQAGRELAARVKDVSLFLAELGLVQQPPPLATPRTIAYQDACHLAHAQRVRAQPRALLSAIEGVTLAEPAEWELCCGSAGTYNIERPEIAARLGERKARNLLETAPDAIASGNIGCMSQLQHQLRQLGRELPVLHTMQVLDRAYAQRL
ncbi:MAG TPA: heterodisulfide reductase-related iron-sulfur binding cluster [Conexibacter sp.]|jgi:glycolate oxidase iron-sulfur subunit